MNPELLDFLKTDVAILVGLISAVVATLATIFGWFGKLAAFWRKHIRQHPHGTPTRTLILQRARGPMASFWNTATSADRPAMQVNVDLLATNIIQQSVVLTNAEIQGLSAEHTWVLVRDEATGMSSQKSPILPGAVAQVRITLLFLGQPYSKGEPFKARLIVYDQFNNRNYTPVLIIESR